MMEGIYTQLNSGIHDKWIYKQGEYMNFVSIDVYKLNTNFRKTLGVLNELMGEEVRKKSGSKIISNFKYSHHLHQQII